VNPQKDWLDRKDGTVVRDEIIWSAVTFYRFDIRREVPAKMRGALSGNGGDGLPNTQALTGQRTPQSAGIPACMSAVAVATGPNPTKPQSWTKARVSSPPPSEIVRQSQALARCHSRLTVVGEIFNTSAVSSMLSPAK